MCEIFKFWSFLQSNHVNTVCKLLQLQGDFFLQTPTRASPLGPVCKHVKRRMTDWIQCRRQTWARQLNLPNVTKPSATVKHAVQESGGELCDMFKLWSFSQSRSVNSVCKLLQLFIYTGALLLNTIGGLPSPDRLGYTPPLKRPGGATDWKTRQTPQKWLDIVAVSGAKCHLAPDTATLSSHLAPRPPWNILKFQSLVVSAVKICKQCLQTASASGGLSPPEPLPGLPSSRTPGL